MHLVQVDREERKDERFTITSILARRIAMGWDPHTWHCIAWWSCLWFSWWHCWSANSTDDHCLNVISYGATREEDEDSVSISSRFLINIIATIIVIIVNMLNVIATIAIISINIPIITIIAISPPSPSTSPLAIILIIMNMLQAQLTTGGEMLTIRQSFGADDRAELTITTIWELTITTIWFGGGKPSDLNHRHLIWKKFNRAILLHCARFVATAYHFNPIWYGGEKHTLSYICSAVVVNENKKTKEIMGKDTILFTFPKYVYATWSQNDQPAKQPKLPTHLSAAWGENWPSNKGADCNMLHMTFGVFSCCNIVGLMARCKVGIEKLFLGSRAMPTFNIRRIFFTPLVSRPSQQKGLNWIFL